ncbi:hypothetical protein AAHC03_04882 [Spirometra sp. Aus1]
MTKNPKLLKLFDLIVRKFPPPQPRAVSEYLKAYKLENLVAAGAGAGLVLRKSWSSWSEGTSQDAEQTKEPLLQLTFDSNTTKTVAKFPGLRNKGNTCYANAALQLLYHCPDFREAVLSPSTFRSPTSTESAKPEHSSKNSDAESCSLWPLQNSSPQTFGRLHETLTQLFLTLSTAKPLQTAYDPSAVLTLSKPSHFVQGEQQDSAEYLNHLLDCLHEEELQSKRRVNQLKLMAEPSDDGGRRHQLSSFGSSVSTTGSVESLTQGASPKLSGQREELMEIECLSSGNEVVERLPNDVSERSIVRSLFGGTLSRRTICSQCNHVSSAELEDFICLFLPIDTSASFSSDCNSTSEKPPANSATADIATLVETHFARSECVTGAGECEACGRESVRERQLSLRHLSPHVLIGLNLFAYNRATQACHKVMRRVRINELLSVRVPKNPPLSQQPSVPPPDTSTTEAASSSTCQVVSLDDEPREQQPLPSPAPDVADESSIHVYKLQGMILHHGLSLSCGHYTCVAKVDSNWVSFDDCSASFTSLDQVNRQQFATPYLLLYSKV